MNGYSWRSGAKVEKRELKQWFFRITAFKEALLKDLDALVDGWPERILSMQRHWIGKSAGARVGFKITTPDDGLDVEVFTTRPDTLHGVQYLALSTTHPLVSKLAKTDTKLQTFLDSAASLPPDTKAGYCLHAVSAVNPIHALEQNTSLPESLPVYVAPYVLGDYGEGAVMGVPGHDSRDYAFWAENTQSAPVSFVVKPKALAKDVTATGAEKAKADGNEAYTGEGIMTRSCGSYSGLPSPEAAQKIVDDLKKQGGLADITESWRLRDWLISRQRYWGAPIPIIHCDHCGAVPVPDEELPVDLPAPDSTGVKPLQFAEEWLHTACPKCGGFARRDTDTMDTFVDSSWYFLRFLDAFNSEAPFSAALARPVDIYVGGIEHAILHLLYSRFIYKFLVESGHVSSSQAGSLAAPEPFLKLLSQGMVHGKTYSDPATGRFLRPEEIDLTNPSAPVIAGTQITPNVTFEKMSKSKYNGVDPTACIASYGSDATRAHTLFSAPVSEVLEWDESKIVGIQRWFNRVWKIVSDSRRSLTDSFSVSTGELSFLNDLHLPALDQLNDDEVELLLSTHDTITSVSRTLENNAYGLNTVISTLIKFTNAVASSPVPSSPSTSPSARTVLYITVTTLLRLLAPIAPAFTSECWKELHDDLVKSPPPHDSTSTTIPSIFSSPWPAPLLISSQLEALRSRGSKTVTVQINGKVRFTTAIPRPPSAGHEKEQDRTSDEDWIVSHILESNDGKVWLREKNDWEKRKRVVVVGGGKIVSVVF